MLVAVCLFQRSGCIVEVRSRSKVDGNEATATSMTISKNLNRRKTKEEQHNEMMQLFEEAKVAAPVPPPSHSPPLLRCRLMLKSGLKQILT